MLEMPGLASASLLLHPTSFKTIPQPTIQHEARVDDPGWGMRMDDPGWGMLDGSAGVPSGRWERAAAGAPARLPTTLSADRYHVTLPLRSPICLTEPICWILPQTVSSLGQRLPFCSAFLQAQHELGQGLQLSHAAATPQATQTRMRFQISCS